MPVCTTSVFWQIELVVRGAANSDTLFFDIESMTGETFTGQVRNAAGNTGPLTGRCSPLSSELEVSAMHFDFQVLGRTGNPVRVLLVGRGHQPNVFGLNPEFGGGFVAVRPTAAAASTPSIPTQIDVGDTGTGNGSQT